ncbi:MAG: dTDP-4-dehydrorhamnose reductase [Pseudomonadota bacterium]
MTILLFGAKGQVGRALADRADVVSLDRDEADLRDPARCARIIETARVDAVINAAAFSDVDGAESAEATARLVNARAPAVMALAAARVGIPFVHLSTAYVFSGKGRLPWRPDSTPEPVQAYGRTRLAGERGVANAGGAHAVLRSSWVHSAEGHNFVRSMIRAGGARSALAVACDRIGSPTPAADLAHAAVTVATALRSRPEASGVYHYAGREAVSRADFARAIFEAAGLDVTVTGVPTEPWHHAAEHPANAALESGLAEEVFGLCAPDWRDGLPALVREACAGRRAA